MAIGDYWELALLGIDGMLAYSFYKAYKHFSAEVNIIEKTPVYEVGPELHSAVAQMPDKCLPYVGIYGLSKISEDNYLESSNSSIVGLIHEATVTEHKSIRIQGFWSEMTRKISSVARACRFGIVAPDVSLPERDLTTFIEVNEPLKADYLLDSLPVIFENYKPSNEGFVMRSLDVIFGEIIRGYQFTEKMLPEGTPVLGMGKVYLTSGKPELCFGPPDFSHNRYILTTLTKSALVGNLRRETRVVKYIYYSFLFTGTALAVWLAYKYFKRNAWISERLRDGAVYRSFSKVDVGVNPSTSLSSSGHIENSCSVCLTLQKNVLLMPCRHLTVCSVCYEALPMPKKCPVCRTFVKECLPIYVT